MEKKKYAIIGKPISHSLSPILHNYWFKKYKIDAEYNLLEIQEKELASVIKKISDNRLHGLNVTLPYKQKVISHLGKTINDAGESYSVNTIFKDEEDNIIGENTDVFGFQAGYLKNIINLEKKKQKVLILWAGGVSPSIILALKKSQIDNISLTNRTHEKSLFLKKKFPNLNIVDWLSYENEIQNFDIIINATSLGLKGNKGFDNFFKNIKTDLIYIDTIYNPYQTNMIKDLKSRNIQTFNGLDMFMYQGQKSFYIWHKINPEIDDELINLLEFEIKK